AGDVRKGLTKLSALASANGDEAKKATLAADQAAGKARSGLGVSSLDQLATQHDKARKEDEALAAALSADRAALGTVDAALKSARVGKK
ncbi:MAG: hypothetical protein ABW061_19510, partial [Polyangiaceae bacterium]